MVKENELTLVHLSTHPKLAMEKVDNVEDILNVQKRIDTGCIAMGLKPRCGVAK